MTTPVRKPTSPTETPARRMPGWAKVLTALLLVLVSIPATVLLMRTDSPATKTERVPV